MSALPGAAGSSNHCCSLILSHADKSNTRVQQYFIGWLQFSMHIIGSGSVAFFCGHRRHDTKSRELQQFRTVSDKSHVSQHCFHFGGHVSATAQSSSRAPLRMHEVTCPLNYRFCLRHCGLFLCIPIILENWCTCALKRGTAHVHSFFCWKNTRGKGISRCQCKQAVRRSPSRSRQSVLGRDVTMCLRSPWKSVAFSLSVCALRSSCGT